jgi:hypothetical protein
MVNNPGNKTVVGLDLLIQSGGAANVGTASTLGANRSKYFANDFYLDDIQFKGLVSGTATGAASNSFELNFTVIEPSGVTFLASLNSAVKEYNTKLGVTNPNLVGQTYLMVVRFYGYNDKGLPIAASDIPGGSDTNAYTEKWIPFMFTGIQFKIESNKVVYYCNAVCTQTQVATDNIHGRIPIDFTLQGNTVRDLFVGNAAENRQGGIKGLINALNAYNKQQQTSGHVMIADEYNIEFTEGSTIPDAKVAISENPVMSRTASPTTAGKIAAIKGAHGPSSVNTTSTTYSVGAGTNIVTLIDKCIRSSTFISSQYVTMTDGNTGKSTPTLKTGEDLIWFKVSPRIDSIIGFDTKRQSWAYKITYVVSEYPVRSQNTSYVTNNRCVDIVKAYDYWFTGKNTEVLDFSQDYNFLYYTAFSGAQVADLPNNNANITTVNVQQVHATQSSQGGNKGTTEQAANIASVLYSPADQALVDIKIVGDPDWIAQSELFYSPNGKTNDSRFKPDGSVDYDSAEVFFSVNFNTIVDYDLRTGLADVTAKNAAGSSSQYKFVYRANAITTQLSKGKFTQSLEGTLVMIPESCKRGGVPDRPMSSALSNTLSGSCGPNFPTVESTKMPALPSGNNIIGEK